MHSLEQPLDPSLWFLWSLRDENEREPLIFMLLGRWFDLAFLTGFCFLGFLTFLSIVLKVWVSGDWIGAERDRNPREKLLGIFKLLRAMDGIEVLHKRMKTTEGSEGDGGVEASGEEAGMGRGSPEMEANIQRILEKIEGFTNRVSELLEAGKALFRDLTADFEDRLIAIHREHIEKWQEEIKQLRMIDASNEATRALLQNAQLHILQSVHED